MPVTNSQEVDFQQVAFGIEAVSDTWNVNVYALVPVDDKEYRLNSVYNGGSLDTYGVDVGYSITPEFETSIGYYYQKGDLGTCGWLGCARAYCVQHGEWLQHRHQPVLRRCL